MLVVGITGVINTLEKPINKLWQHNELAAMTRKYAGKGALAPSRYGSLDKALAEARKVLPGNNPQFIGFPGGQFQFEASLCGIFPREHAPYRAPADARIDRRGDWTVHSSTHDALV